MIAAVQQARYQFAHILRGLAALSVVISHFFGVFWVINPDILALVRLPPLPNLPQPGLPASQIMTFYLALGMFGVGIFFVISGFVITLAIERETIKSFVMRRLLRIYPTYAAGFLAMMLAVYISTRMAGTQFNYGVSHLALHTLILARGLFGDTRIDGISWTLEIEVVYYALMAGLGATLLRRRLPGLVVAVQTILAVCLPMNLFRFNAFIGMQVSCGLMLCAGIAYALHATHRIDTRELI